MVKVLFFLCIFITAMVFAADDFPPAQGEEMLRTVKVPYKSQPITYTALEIKPNTNAILLAGLSLSTQPIKASVFDLSLLPGASYGKDGLLTLSVEPIKASVSDLSLLPGASYGKDGSLGFGVSYSKTNDGLIVFSTESMPIKAPTFELSLFNYPQVVTASRIVLEEKRFVFDADKYLGDLGLMDDILANLAISGIEVKDNRVIESLPKFFLATQFLTQLKTTSDEINVALSSQLPIVCVRFIDADADVTKKICDAIEAETKRKFILIVNSDVFNKNVAKILNHKNVAMIIVGHYVAADERPAKFTDRAEEVLNRVKFIRKISNKPVVLACSYTHFFNPITTKDWANAFGAELAKFDGFAIYNISRFQAFEFINRKKACKNLGLPDTKPVVLLDFVGTQGVNDDVKESWKRKLEPFAKMLVADGWNGMIVYANQKDDAAFKDKVLFNLPEEYRFKQ